MSDRHIRIERRASERPKAGRGVFIVFEGGEGSGKSTQSRIFAERLVGLGFDVVQTREPGGTEVGEDIRAMLLHGHDLDARSELLLMSAARAMHIEQKIRPSIEAGKIVVCDRYVLSSMAYQGYGRGIPIEDIRAISDFATYGLYPDMNIVITVPDEVSKARRVNRKADRIESAGDAFHDRVQAGYEELAFEVPGSVLVSGEGAISDVSERVWQIAGYLVSKRMNVALPGVHDLEENARTTRTRRDAI